jgi:hypothetical protein
VEETTVLGYISAFVRKTWSSPRNRQDVHEDFGSAPRSPSQFASPLESAVLSLRDESPDFTELELAFFAAGDALEEESAPQARSE